MLRYRISKQMLKYAIVGYIVLMFLILFEFNQMLSVKTHLEKKVAGIKTGIEKMEAYKKQLQNFEITY
ncbi:MAG: hypothetical protein COU25_03800 [Candidatus Levybacteria bacterium CG10_big_fil_rev_8_21_14_0_10_35_13]|nr:MAG: hypothetical protein COU25_03800 [Candidatus Levybacteria bacterium CG10_big_fil_rev_8_21_14_0_10_35_13]